MWFAGPAGVFSRCLVIRLHLLTASKGVGLFEGLLERQSRGVPKIKRAMKPARYLRS